MIAATAGYAPSERHKSENTKSSQVDVADLDAMIDCPQLDETVLH